MNTMPTYFPPADTLASLDTPPVIDLSAAARRFYGNTVHEYVAKLLDPTTSEPSRRTIQLLLSHAAAQAGFGFSEKQKAEFGFGVDGEGNGMPYVRPSFIYTVGGKTHPLTPYTHVAPRGP